MKYFRVILVQVVDSVRDPVNVYTLTLHTYTRHPHTYAHTHTHTHLLGAFIEEALQSVDFSADFHGIIFFKLRFN